MARDLSEDIRNENLTGEPPARLEDFCDLVVVCESASSPVTRWTLLAKHGARRDRRYGRIACPRCRGRAWWQLGDMPQRERKGPGLIGHLLFPFRRDQGEEEDMGDCVVCRAYAERDGDADVFLATMVLDGNGVCDRHGAPMLKVIAEKLPEVAP